MLASVLLAATALLAALETPQASAPIDAPAAVVTVVETVDEQAPGDVPTPPTINEFIPEDRSIGECISALPKPGCGSEARGGWRQSLILVAILGGLGFIAWRVIRAARRSSTDSDLTEV